MAKKKSKRIEDVSDELKGDKLHLYRLKRFLQYLKQYDAEIKLNKGDGFPLMFKANGKRGELHLRDLVAEALNIKKDYASKLLNDPLKFSGLISNKDRIDDLGDVIDDITLHFGSHMQPEKFGYYPFRDLFVGFYHTRNHLKKLRSPIKKDSNSTNIFERTKSWVDQTSIIKTKVLKFLSGPFWVSGYIDDRFFHPMFYEEMVDLCSIFAENSQESRFIEVSVHHELNLLIKTYSEVLQGFNQKKGLLPGYVDLSILCNDESYKRSIKDNFGTEEQFRVDSNHFGIEQTIIFRYEIIKMLVQQNIAVDRWTAKDQALLLLCNAEMLAVNEYIKQALVVLKKHILFSLYTSNSHNSTKDHLTHLKSESISKVLMHYNIRHSMDELFEINVNSILKHPLKAIADTYAVEHYYSKDDINNAIHHEMNLFLKKKFVFDLHGNEKLFITDLDREFF